ncbi:MAG TPA: hypothetical protein GX400_20620 [Chloroflexi bacterium]|nr:hypothetical protein [Chloroflexota bacterium]
MAKRLFDRFNPFDKDFLPLMTLRPIEFERLNDLKFRIFDADAALLHDTASQTVLEQTWRSRSHFTFYHKERKAVNRMSCVACARSRLRFGAWRVLCYNARRS